MVKSCTINKVTQGTRFPVTICNLEFHCIPDTGSDANIMSHRDFAKIKTANPKIKLQNKSTELKSITNHKLPCLGMFVTQLSSMSASCTDKIFVMENKFKISEPILSESCLLNLGLVSYSAEGKYALKVAQVSAHKDILQQLMCKYPDVFNDKDGRLGRFRHFKAEIALAPDAKPFIAKPRQIPLHWEDKVRAKLEEMIKQNVLGWCPPDMSIRFCSALVIVKKKDGSPRVTVDFRMLNKYLSRSRVTTKLTIENLIAKIAGLKYFFTVDISDAFHQIPIKKKSRNLTVIATPWGNLYYKRLSQGLLPSSDIFDNAMAGVLQGIPNTCSYRDDVWGGGKTLEEHDRVLSAVIERFALNGVVIKSSKCSVRQTTIKFLGHIFNAQGMKPDPDKVKTIKIAKRPETRDGLVSYLCTMGFLQRFCPRFSELAGPLHDLARKSESNMILWDTQHEAMFEELRAALVDTTLLNSFDKSKETSLWCDAGKTSHIHNQRGGFSAILAQRDSPVDPWKPIYFASKRMSDPHSRWGQTELESESILFGCKKFSYFIDGISRLTIFTDCKALLPIYNRSEKCDIPPRIERGVLAIQHLPYTLVYVPGKENRADWPSRNALEVEENLKKGVRIRKTNSSLNKLNSKFQRGIIFHGVKSGKIQPEIKPCRRLFLPLRIILGIRFGKWLTLGLIGLFTNNSQ